MRILVVFKNGFIRDVHFLVLVFNFLWIFVISNRKLVRKNSFKTIVNFKNIWGRNNVISIFNEGLFWWTVEVNLSAIKQVHNSNTRWNHGRRCLSAVLAECSTCKRNSVCLEKRSSLRWRLLSFPNLNIRLSFLAGSVLTKHCWHEENLAPSRFPRVYWLTTFNKPQTGYYVTRVFSSETQRILWE